jgi:hypothetical protein
MGQVEMPTSEYNGQKLTRLVRTKTAANTKPTMPKVPLIVPLKYKNPIIAATAMRTIRSRLPIFAFIMFNFKEFLKNLETV